MGNVCGQGFTDLMKDFCDSKRHITIVHSNLGPLSGKIIEIKPDYLNLLMLDTKTETWYNIFVPLSLIVALQTSDPIEGMAGQQEENNNG